MTQVGSPLTTAPPTDPVEAAITDPELQKSLRLHVLASMRRWLPDRPQANHQEAANDILQETMLRAVARKNTFDPARARAAGWLHGIMNHVLMEFCRKLRQQPLQPEADPEAWAAVATRLEKNDNLTELLDQLPDDHRDILRMRFLEGLSHQEIAVRLGIRVGYSRTRLSRAMDAAKKLGVKGGGQ